MGQHCHSYKAVSAAAARQNNAKTLAGGQPPCDDTGRATGDTMRSGRLITLRESRRRSVITPCRLPPVGTQAKVISRPPDAPRAMSTVGPSMMGRDRDMIRFLRADMRHAFEAPRLARYHAPAEGIRCWLW